MRLPHPQRPLQADLALPRRQMQIPGSVIEKCQHGVYLASALEVRNEKATYCGLCTPEGAYPDPNWNKAVEQNPLLKRHFDNGFCSTALFQFGSGYAPSGVQSPQ